MAGAHAIVRAATRGSTLARTQTSTVASLLRAHFPGLCVEHVVVETAGDRRRDAQIWELGGRGVFVKEVQTAVLEGRADVAVHSAKDLPSTAAPGLIIAAVPERGDPRDAIVGSTLDGIPVGGLVGTGSVRRRAQLAWLRPDLTFSGLRGNVETRLVKAADFDAVVMAAVALERTGRRPEPLDVLEPWVMVPQVGQGALAVECRIDDSRTRELVAAIDHGPSRMAVEAERAFLRQIGGGCDRPVGAHASVDGAGISLTGLVATGDGRMVLRHTGKGAEPAELGRQVARYLLDEAGGTMVMSDLMPARP